MTKQIGGVRILKSRKRNLSTVFLLPILLAVLIILVLSMIMDVIKERDLLMKDLTIQTENLMNISAAAASTAFWNYNDSELKDIGDILYRYKEVSKVQLSDGSEKIIYEQNKAGTAYQVSDHYQTFSRKLFKEGTFVGEIRLDISMHFLKQQIQQAILYGVVRTFIIIAIIFMIILGLTRNIIHSLEQIAKGVRSFSEGDTHQHIEVKSGQEVNELANRINSMFTTIVDSRNRLTENYEKLKNKEEALRISEEQYRYAVEGSNDAMWDWHVATSDYYVSSRGFQIVGLSNRDEMTLNTWRSFIHPTDVAGFERFLNSFVTNPESYAQVQYRVIGSKGNVRWLFCRGKGILDDQNELVRVSGFFTDITERIEAEESINRLAYYDVLTGLPNRVMLFNRLNNYFSEEDAANQSGALLFLDLDDFKKINDTKGHTVGDKVLVDISTELSNNLSYDAIARVGGDEFVVLKKDCDVMSASQLATQIIDIIRKPWSVDGFEFNMTCSIGIAIFPDDGQDINKLLMNADNAMYQAKDQGKDHFKFYEKSMNDLMVMKIKMQDEIRQGIANHEFVVYYQPQVDFNTLEIVGVEALVRWQHPVKGLLPPGAFIGIAEENGQIIPMGEYILEAACQQSVIWEKSGFTDISIAVNISAKQFSKKTLVEDVLRIIEASGMRPELLDIEITESIAMENLENTVYVINTLKEKGIKFSLDDFGTGYSSLNYLKHLPIDHLKIDKQFVQNVRKDNFEDVVVKAIVEIAHSMALVIIAEGVETTEQFETLKACHCDLVQGYLFSKPVPHKEIEALMIQNKKEHKEVTT